MPISGAAPPPLAACLGIHERPTPQYPLARDIVRYAGEPVAVIVARSRAEVKDAADLMAIDYDPLPAVVDTKAAVRPDSPYVYPEWGDNVTLSFSHCLGNPDAAIAAADVVEDARRPFDVCVRQAPLTPEHPQHPHVFQPFVDLTMRFTG